MIALEYDSGPDYLIDIDPDELPVGNALLGLQFEALQGIDGEILQGLGD